MSTIRTVADIEECRRIWTNLMPTDSITDLWEVRDCFHRHFKNPACFVISEDAQGINGLLPLSWIEESQYYGYFPGETSHGKTWLEQNRIPCRNGMHSVLLANCPTPRHVRYLLPVPGQADPPVAVDELRYTFHPPLYHYDMNNYLLEFSSKSRKRLQKDIEHIHALGVQYRYDTLEDFEYMADLNVERFGEMSYFHDVRFRNSFRSLVTFFRENNLLRITTVLVDGIPMAVDMGCIYKGTYTVLAGGTNPMVPGVAKLINLHHLTFACEQRLSTVDFLCGDFSWKKLFHLTESPLYLFSDQPPATAAPESTLTECTTRGR